MRCFPVLSFPSYVPKKHSFHHSTLCVRLGSSHQHQCVVCNITQTPFLWCFSSCLNHLATNDFFSWIVPVLQCVCTNPLSLLFRFFCASFEFLCFAFRISPSFNILKSLLFSQLEFVKESQIQFQNSVSLAILFSFSPRFCEWLIACLFFYFNVKFFLGSSQEETLAEPTRKQYKSFSEEFDA